MRDVFLDVTMEVSAADVLNNPKNGQMILDKLLPAAEARVAMVPGARLRTDRKVEMIFREAEHKLTGEDMILIATRWPVVVPDDADLAAPPTGRNV